MANSNYGSNNLENRAEQRKRKQEPLNDVTDVNDTMIKKRNIEFDKNIIDPQPTGIFRLPQAVSSTSSPSATAAVSSTSSSLVVWEQISQLFSKDHCENFLSNFSPKLHERYTNLLQGIAGCGVDLLTDEHYPDSTMRAFRLNKPGAIPDIEIANDTIYERSFYEALVNTIRVKHRVVLISNPGTGI